ncbi:MAG: type II toxin-antitoxin system RelE/ParE family toxin [Acidobacteria bacterium]|nr:type II toxin-antitoxin system RelE/ParE family toxin [Acidobacteriota bacterium]
MKPVRVTRDAEADLDEIWLYVARDSEDVAAQLIDEITGRFTLLAHAPRIGRQRNELLPGVRTHVVGNYGHSPQRKDTGNGRAPCIVGRPRSRHHDHPSQRPTGLCQELFNHGWKPQGFGVEIVANEIQVLTGPRADRQPNRRVKFSDSGSDKGSTGL